MFGWAVGLGAAVGFVMAWHQAPAEQRPALTEGAAWATVGLVAGGRAAYVLAHWGAFVPRPWAAIAFWEGGSAWPGAVIGYLLGVVVAAWRQPIGWRALSDALLPFAAGLALGAWVGCAWEGCAYGAALPHGLAWPDEAGRWAPRLPLPLLAATGVGLILGAVDYLRQRCPPPGFLTGSALLGGGVLMGWVGFLRADPLPRWGGVPSDLWAALGLMALGLALIFWSRSVP